MYSLPNIKSILLPNIKAIRMRRARHVTRMWERRVPHKVLVENPEGKDHFVRPDVDWRIIFRWILGGGMGDMDLIDLAEDGQVAGPCERRNEPSGSLNAGNSLTSWEPVCFSRRTLLIGVSK
jgi:hypothetical protein